MSCVLRVSGSNFPVEECLKATNLYPIKVWHKGQIQILTKKPSTDSGFNVTVSEEFSHNLEAQVAHAIAFLQQSYSQVESLANFLGVENVTLDFGLEWPNSVAHYDYFPAELISLAGKLGIALEISHYAVSESGGSGAS